MIQADRDALPRPTLLAVLAHPDDESFGPGGTLALYAGRGVAVHLVCATGGEAGTVDPEFLRENPSIADLRLEKELRCAAEALGLARVHALGYRDSGMPGSPDNHHPQALAAQPVGEVAARLAAYIRALRPQVVLTHDPIGEYRHPDHIAVHQAAVRAFRMAGDPAVELGNADLPPFQPKKLYYQVFPKRFLTLAVRLLPLLGQDPRRFGRNRDIDLVDLTRAPDFPIHAVIDYRAVAGRKAAAMDCHASQRESGPPRGGLMGWLFSRWANREHFTRAYPSPEPGLREDDLFAGLALWRPNRRKLTDRRDTPLHQGPVKVRR